MASEEARREGEKGYLQIEAAAAANPGGPEGGGSAEEGYIQVSASENQGFDSKTIGNNPYIPYLSIDTQSKHPEGKILIQNTPEIESVLSQIKKIKGATAVLETINQAVKDAIGLIIP